MLSKISLLWSSNELYGAFYKHSAALRPGDLFIHQGRPLDGF
jgi:hypothetical protein